MNYTIESEALTVVVSDLGAELQSLKSRDGTEFLWQGDARYWSSRATNLFPYVGRLNEGSYYYDGQLYQMKIHGFASAFSFEPVARERDSLVLELRSGEETLRQYPRAFAFRVGYALTQNTLSIRFAVQNLDSREMIFGVGGHPGFNVPLDGGRFEDAEIVFGQAEGIERLEFDAACHPTGRAFPFTEAKNGRLPLCHDLFDDDAIVLKGTGGIAALRCGAREVVVRYPQMPYLGLWHRPHTDAPYVCIEPWRSLPSPAGGIVRFEGQPDLIHLKAGGEYVSDWSITVR